MVAIVEPVSSTAQRLRDLTGLLGRFGLSRPPFPVTPDYEAWFLSARLQACLDDLVSAIALRKGFALVTGEVGVGKSTLARVLLEELRRGGACTSLVIHSVVRGAGLLRAIVDDFGVPHGGGGTAELLAALNRWLLERHAQGVDCVVLIDDAQALDVSSLELVRQLSNLETARDKLLQVVLVGQPELLDTLSRPEIRQLRSRIALHVHLEPLTPAELDAYLHHRLASAGNAEAFRMTPQALSLLARATGGVPRLVNLAMDRCLYALIGRDLRVADVALVRLALADAGVGLPSPRGATFVRRLALAGGALAASAAVAIAALVPGRDGDAPHPAIVAAAGPAGESPAETAPVRDDAPAPPSGWREFWQAHGFDTPPVDPPAAPLDAWIAGANAALAGHGWQLVALTGGAAPCAAATDLPLAAGNARERPRLVLFRAPAHDGLPPFGSSAVLVGWAQRRLHAAGLMAAGEVDATMGPRTAQALAGFQRRRGLVPSGVLDQATRHALSCAPGADA